MVSIMRYWTRAASDLSPGRSAEPIFLLDQCPFRNVDIVGWISSLSYVPVKRDHDDPTMRLVMSGECYFRELLAYANAQLKVDDGNGTYVLPVSKTLKHELVDRKHQAPVQPLLSEPPLSRQRYISVADQQKREIKEAKTNTKSKRHLYPDISVGDIVRIRGRMKEWSRRNGEVIREVVVDQDGGSICQYRGAGPIVTADPTIQALQPLGMNMRILKRWNGGSGRYTTSSFKPMRI